MLTSLTIILAYLDIVVTQAYYKLYTVGEKALCLMKHNIVLDFQLIKFHFEIWNVYFGSHLLKIRKFDLKFCFENLQYDISQKTWCQFWCKWDRVNPIAYGGGFLSHTTIVSAATLKPLKLWLPNFVTSCFYLFATI